MITGFLNMNKKKGFQGTVPGLGVFGPWIVFLLMAVFSLGAEEKADWKLVYERDLSKGNLIKDWMVFSGEWSQTADGIKKVNADGNGCLILRLPVVQNATKITFVARAEAKAGDLSLLMGTARGEFERAAFFGFGSSANTKNKIIFNAHELAKTKKSLIKKGTWHEITAVREKGKLSLTIDGKLVLTADDDPYGMGGPYIGLYAWFPATFKSIRVWRRADKVLRKFQHRGVAGKEEQWLKGTYYPNRVPWLKTAFADYHELMKRGIPLTKSPLKWIPPETVSIFRPTPGLGLPALPGVEHTITYDPKPCKASVNEGGNGKYESVLHGRYNHHQIITVFKHRLIVNWTNHANDENGPGQRILARVGRFRKNRTVVDWGKPLETIIELAPAAVPVRRRPVKHDPKKIVEIACSGRLHVKNGRLYFSGRLFSTHGYTNEFPYRSAKPGRPIPAKNWNDNYEPEKGWDKDIFWRLNFNYYQQWDFKDGKLVPVSAMYVKGKIPDKIEVTPGRFKTVLQPGEPYASAKQFDQAPEQFKNDILRGKGPDNKKEIYETHANYASAAARLASADGTNALAHQAEYQRADGKWVAIRDNLAVAGFYYAQVRDTRKDFYPPAHLTNLPGVADPAAGNLKNGWSWILGNARSRREMYLVLSRDGIVFDRSWSILTIEGEMDKTFKNYIGKYGGPQYFASVMTGGSIWVAYSIGKRKEGVTRIPMKAIINAAAYPAKGAK